MSTEDIANRLRALADALVSNEIDGVDAVAVEAHLDDALATVAKYPHGSLYRAIPEGLPTMHSMASILGDEVVAAHPFRLFSPVVGRSNPVAPPAEFVWDDDRVIGTCTYGARYEGAPGCVHGGFIAAVFDDCLGLAQGRTGQGGMTAYLNVQYRRPHRLHRLIRFSAWVESVEGRKIVCKGQSIDDESGDLLGECEALFVTVDFAKIRAAAEAAANPGVSTT